MSYSEEDGEAGGESKVEAEAAEADAAEPSEKVATPPNTRSTMIET